MQIVNGYVCQTTCDVALAKRGINPAYPNANPQSPTYSPAAAAKADHGPAYNFGGALATGSASGPTLDGSSPTTGAGATASATAPGGVKPSGSGSTVNTQPGALLSLLA